jgi:hypothetical protein
MEVVAAPRKYPDELGERAIRFALDLVDGAEKLSVNAAGRRVGEQLGIARDSGGHPDAFSALTSPTVVDGVPGGAGSFPDA